VGKKFLDPLRTKNMNAKYQLSSPPLGLLASGSSQMWEISVEESLAGTAAWFLEIESRTIYLAFQLSRLESVFELRHFLETHYNEAATIDHARWDENIHTLTVGIFGTEPVQFVWDNEGFPRCFIVLGSQISSLRWCVAGEEIPSLIDALQQVIEDLSLPEPSP
jgi:hypothetical protein